MSSTPDTNPSPPVRPNVRPFDDTFGSVIDANGMSLDDFPREDVIGEFKKAGMLMFSGFNISPEEFNAYSDRYSDDFLSYKGGRYERRAAEEKVDSTIVSVSYYVSDKKKQDTWPLPMHGEMYYTRKRPVMIWFYCKHPALKDGETTVLDGERLLHDLKPETRKLFEEQRLKYIRFYPEEEWRVRFQTDDINEVERFCLDSGMTVQVDRDQKTVTTEFLHPAIITSAWGNHAVFINNILPVAAQELVAKRTDNLVRLEDGSSIPLPALQDIQAKVEKLIRKIPWKAGDFALVDNTRVLHGRAGFDDNVRQIYSRMVLSVDW